MENENLQKLTGKEKKSVILDAYNKALAIIDNLQSGTFNPEAEKAAEESKKVLENAEEIVHLDILNESILTKYNDLLKAIEIKKKELKEYAGIEVTVNTVAALVQAKSDLQASLQKEIDELKDEKSSILDEIDNLRESTEKELNELRTRTLNDIESEDRALRDSLKLKRDREEEEYQYDLKRTHLKAEDAWNDKMNAQKASLAEIKNEIEERESAVKAKEDELESLRKQVELIPSQIDKAVTEAINTQKTSDKKSLEAALNNVKNEYNSKLALVQKELEMTKELLKKSEFEKDKLYDKLESAQNSVRQIASSAVQTKYISSEK